MNRIDFDIVFEKLCASIAPTHKMDIKSTGDVYYERFRTHKAAKFESAIDIVIDKEKFFPSVSTVVSALKNVYDSTVAKIYQGCPVCDTSGYVSMLLSFTHKKDSGGKLVRYVKDRRHWQISLQRQLTEETGDRYYCYALFCRCEKGVDIQELRQMKNNMITPDEFDELKTQAGDIKKNINCQSIGEVLKEGVK